MGIEAVAGVIIVAIISGGAWFLVSLGGQRFAAKILGKAQKKTRRINKAHAKINKKKRSETRKSSSLSHSDWLRFFKRKRNGSDT